MNKLVYVVVSIRPEGNMIIENVFTSSDEAERCRANYNVLEPNYRFEVHTRVLQEQHKYI